MTETTRRRRIEVLADKPLIRQMTNAAKEAGIDHYTLLPVAGGMGDSGSWSDDQVTGATAKQMFLAICDDAHADAFASAIKPLLDSHGLMLLISNVEVLRADHY